MHIRTHDYLVTAVIEREVVNEIRGPHKGRVTGWPAAVRHCRPASVPYNWKTPLSLYIFFETTQILLMQCGNGEEDCEEEGRLLANYREFRKLLRRWQCAVVVS